MADDKEKNNFWTTLPGILTGIAGLITSVGGFIIGIHSFPSEPTSSTFSPGQGTSPVSEQTSPTCFSGPDRNILRQNKCLEPNSRLLSSDRKYELYCQGDGNLVFRRILDGKVAWKSEKFGKVENCYMQDDGNLVVNSLGGKPAIWSSEIPGRHEGAYVKVEDEHVRIYDSNGSILWDNGGLT